MEISPKLNLEIIKKIESEGVNSALYIVRDEQMNRELILKQIDKKKLKEYDKYFEESKKISKLRHPNIITINYASYDDDYIYLTMPYYKNGSLNQLLDQRSLTVKEIIKYSIDFLSAIYYIHDNNMIHCDIKPNNILINDNNQAILSDFGSAIQLDYAGLGKLKNVYYKHIAPEQCVTSTVNKSIDIYQIGTTLYRMCNGNEEYNNQLKKYKNLNDLKIAISKGKFPVRKKYLPHIPRSLIEIMEKCLQVNKDERYESVLEILNDLSCIKDNLNWRYSQRSKNYYTWIEDENYIILKKDNKVWNIESNIVENEAINLESKAQGYRRVRRIIKENKKTLL
ncbi:MAG: serine/threonine-protein kinase [Terrisporobacter sp.]|uniref:serine/threonine-protein kinase n=1 Tax=Terrisporobacter sp. TaxID=1965305 RepID=UPI002FC64C01